MKKFAREIPEEEILQKVFAKLLWGHIIALLDKVKSESERAFYIDLLFYNVKLHCYFVSSSRRARSSRSMRAS